MKNYTAMYIIHPELGEDARAKTIEALNAVFTDNGSTIEKVDEWGMRDLAYEIEDQKKGYYVLLKVAATPAAVSEYSRICNIREDIIRYIIVKDE